MLFSALWSFNFTIAHYCHIVRSNHRTASTYNCGAFGPRKASKVEKPSSRGVSSLHCNGLRMLLPVLNIHACALSAHTRVRMPISANATTHLWLAATPLSLLGAGTVYSDILGLLCYTLIWLCKQLESETIHGTGSFKDPLNGTLKMLTCCQLITNTIVSRR